MQKVSEKENKNAFVTLVLQEPFHMSKYRNVILFNFISILCWLQQISYTPCTREKKLLGNTELRGTPGDQASAGNLRCHLYKLRLY